MRDQQARGKDPYDEQEDEHDNKHFISQKQEHAAQMLNSPESLMNEAQRTSDTVPRVRRNCERILSGISEGFGQCTSENSSKKSNREYKKPSRSPKV
ncbi:hypothetical protein PG990_009315 [Apiospora arundinis]